MYPYTHTKFVPKIKIFITKSLFNIYIKSKTKVNIEVNNKQMTENEVLN
jgi:hypothetical protein